MSPAPAASRLILPVLTPYDRQVLVQSIARAVARWGAAQVEVGPRALVVEREAAPAARRCGRCGDGPVGLHCRERGGLTCVGCALDAIAGAARVAVVGPCATRPAHSEDHSSRADASRPSAAQHRQ